MATPEYGSDVMALALESLDLDYIALNPGASYRGLHDSLVNFTDSGGKFIQCTHEKLAIAIAHGYAKASGKMMCAIVHDTVGLMHATMGIYCAFIDRVPVLILGGTGPMATELRRPWIDWVHTAQHPADLVRGYTKWDDQPASVMSVPPSIARAARVALTEPQGPVYVALDAGLQEESVPEDGGAAYEPVVVSPPRRMRPADDDVADLFQKLVAAERPVIVPGYVGRDPRSFALLVELAERVGAGVVDSLARLNFPTRHPLNVTSTPAVAEADLILLLDVKDPQRYLVSSDPVARTTDGIVAPGAQLISVGYDDLGISAWSQDFGALVPVDELIHAEAIDVLIGLVEQARTSEPVRAATSGWRSRMAELVETRNGKWSEAAIREHESVPVSTSRLATEVWTVVSQYDWVLTAGAANDWAFRIWDFDAPHRYPGATLGTGTQIGISLGVALAHKGSGRLVVDLQPDGDLLFDPQSMWTAAHHEIPLLVVMFNNEAYYNDWQHQESMAVARGRDVDMAYLGMDLSEPSTDFAMMAKSFGWHSEGPITNGDEIAAAVARAAEVVVKESRPALVDVRCANK